MYLQKAATTGGFLIVISRCVRLLNLDFLWCLNLFLFKGDSEDAIF